MADDKKDILKIRTGRGVASWPHLHAPDTKFNAAGVYSVKLILPAEESGEYIAQFETMAEKRLEEAKAEFAEKFAEATKAQQKKMADKEPVLATDVAWAEVYDDNDDETGEFAFNFKMKASGVSKKNNKPWTMSPKLFDAKGKPVKAGLRVFGGSVLKVNGEAAPYYMPATGKVGVSLRLNAVQIIELRSGGDASSYGFGEEDGGFDADDVADDAFGEDKPANATATEAEGGEEDGEEADF